MQYIEQSIEAYEKLMNYKYNLLVGNSKKKFKLVIQFTEDNYWHLLGFGAIKDIPQFKKNKAILYSDLKNKNEKVIEILNKHSIFNEDKYIKRRKELSNLEKLLDSNHCMVRINRFIPGSDIVANFIISQQINDQLLYLFLKSNSTKMGMLPEPIDNYMGVSFFPKDKKDYNLNQLNQHLFYKEKICMITNTKEIQVTTDGLTKDDTDFNC